MVSLVKIKVLIMTHLHCRELFFTKNGQFLLDEGAILKREKYANTLERISMLPDDLYTGDLGRQFALDVQNKGGIMSFDDLKNYKVIERQPLVNKFGKLTHYTLPAPNGGPVLTHILNMNEGNVKCYLHLAELVLLF